MPLISTLPVHSWRDTLSGFAGWLPLRRSEKRLLGGVWSVAELGLSESEYEWCRHWASQIDRGEAEIACQRVVAALGPPNARISPAVAFGALLFIAEAEHARRHATEGTLWPAMRSLPFRQDTRDLLFLPSIGQPTPRHKQLLEDSARALSMRHVFGIEGLQNWFSSFYLQFGFTRRGFENGLAHWLSGYNRPQAITHLDSPGRLHSGSFSLVWSALSAFRRNNATEANVRPILRNSPWILPEWHDEIVSAARRHPDLVDVAAGETEGEPAEIEFLKNPRLVWNGTTSPMVTVEIANTSMLDLSADTYLLQSLADQTTLAQALRQPGGFYAIVPDGPLTMAARGHTIGLSFVTLDGEVHASQEISLFDPGEDVVMFKYPDGGLLENPYDPALQVGGAFILVTAPDLAVAGLSPAAVFEGEDRHLRLYEEGWSGSISVLLESQPLWTSDTFLHLPPAIPAGAVRCEWAPLGVGNARSIESGILRVHIPADLQLQAVRVAGMTVPLRHSHNGSYQSDLFNLPAFGLDAEIPVALSVVASGRTTRLRTRVRLAGDGLIRHAKTGSHLFDPEKTISARSASSDRFTIMLAVPEDVPRQAIYRERALCEGPVFHSRPSSRKQVLPRLHGYGAPLIVEERPFNALTQGVQLARAVIDGGVVVGREPDDENGALVLKFTTQIEPSSDHWVLVWHGDDEFSFHAPEVEPDRPWCWRIRGLDCREMVFRAALVGYQKRRIGSYWSDQWSDLLSEGCPADRATTVARAIRAFKLPLLDPDLRYDLEVFRDEHWLTLISAWLCDDSWSVGEREIEMPAIDDPWLSVLNSVFFAFASQVEAADAEFVFDGLNGGAELGPIDSITAAATKLIEVSPWLMGAVVRAWAIAYVPLHQGGPSAAITAARQALLAPLSPEAAITECARLMAVDEQFITAGLLNHISAVDMAAPIHRRNIQRAVQQRIFRRLAGHRLLLQ